MAIVVTGAAGYIGSHACLRLLAEGHRVVAIDNLCRGHEAAIALLQARFPSTLRFVRTDIADVATVADVLRQEGVQAVLHFAALAYVGESVTEPLRYYRANAAGSLALLDACVRAGVHRFVLSSTCATYGEPSAEHIPIPETCPQRPINPYGRSKLHVEHMLFDHAEAMRRADVPFAFAALRYFNVAGCDRTGLLGEDHDPETHLIPVVLRAVQGLRPPVTVFGEDYPTPDGTCIRDYIHVEDLIDAHVRVLAALAPGQPRVYNLGIGRGSSVKQVIASAERVTGRKVPWQAGERRPGDPPTLFADPTKIQRELGWRASITSLDEIVASAWKWFAANPIGYAGRATSAAAR